MDRRILTSWVIYFNTSDYPGKYVGRLHTCEAGTVTPTAHHRVSGTLEEARKHVPRQNDFCMQRKEGDDPVIVETWI